MAYDDKLLGWQLDEQHPTNPVRAKLCVEQLGRLEIPMIVEAITVRLADELAVVHTPEYVRQTLAGHNEEWSGTRPDLGDVAAHMFAGTVQLAHGTDRGDVRIGFSPQGAKHHAMADRGSGFCVFNDMGWAALHFAARGKRVLYVDLDAHHGDGVEALTRDEPLVMTCSVHDRTIFPWTGHDDEPEKGVYNHPLPAGSGDEALLSSVQEIGLLASCWRPQVVLVAIGADGHVTDPLSSLRYTYDGYARAGAVLGGVAAQHDAPVLMGGAGGYQPQTHTPRVWATFVEALALAHLGADDYVMPNGRKR